MPFCFMMKKNYFKQKLLLWPLVSFDHFEVSASIPSPLPICMYILIHSYKQNDENRTLSRVVPSTALIVYLNKFFSFLKSVFKLFIWITLRMKYKSELRKITKLKNEILEHCFISANTQIMYALLNK